jgi:hypothetical protein
MKRLLVLGLALVVVVACGPTVDVPPSTSSLPQAGVTPVTSAATPGGVTGPGVTAPPVSASSGISGITPVTAAVGVPVTAPTVGTPSPTSSSTGVGVTATTVTLGIDTFSNAQAASAAGLSGVPSIGGKQAYSTVVNYLNAHGGIAGRQIKPIYFEEPLGSSTPAQSVCADFTQDNHVFAVVSDRSHLDGNLVSCLGPSDTPLGNDFEGYYDSAMVEGYSGGMYLPDDITGQRLVNDWIPALAAMGYFAPNDRVGLLVIDDPIYLKAAALVPAALAAVGQKMTAESEVDVSDTAAIAGQMASSVLAFKSDKIDHVIIMDEAPDLTVLWPEAAESQSYFPRYALNSFNTPGFASENVPANELHGAVGIGWMPWEDVTENVPPPNAAAQYCSTMFTAAGISLSGPNNADIAYSACTLILWFKAAFERTTVFTPDGFRAAVDAMGTAFQSPYTFSTYFTPGHQDGAAAYRDLAYGDACKCFSYTGPIEPLK